MKVLTTVNFGSFPGKIMFACGLSFEEICYELKKQKCYGWIHAIQPTLYLFSKDNQAFASRQKMEKNGKEYVFNFLILKDEFNFSDYHHTILSHEAIHLCTYNLSDRLDIVKENEAFAYTHTHILTQIYAAIRECKKNSKRKR